MRVGGVDGDRAHPGALGRGDLVAHEGDERRDEQGGARAGAAKQQRRDEVHGGLAPAGALHDERAAALLDEGADGLELAVVEVDVVAADELAEGVEGGGAQFGHGIQPARSR